MTLIHRRIGRPGRVKVDPHAELAIAQTAAQQFEARKRRRGYG
jgi:predicted DNA-binding WGR domain protein